MSKNNIRKMSRVRAVKAYFPRLSSDELAALCDAELTELATLAKEALLQAAA